MYAVHGNSEHIWTCKLLFVQGYAPSQNGQGLAIHLRLKDIGCILFNYINLVSHEIDGLAQNCSNSFANALMFVQYAYGFGVFGMVW